jgi:hypothetical protein
VEGRGGLRLRPLSAAGEDDDVGRVCVIGGDDGGGGPGEFVGAVTVPVWRVCCGWVGGSGVVVAAPQPEVQSTVGLSGRVVGLHELGPCHGGAG